MGRLFMISGVRPVLCLALPPFRGRPYCCRCPLSTNNSRSIYVCALPGDGHQLLDGTRGPRPQGELFRLGHIQFARGDVGGGTVAPFLARMELFLLHEARAGKKVSV